MIINQLYWRGAKIVCPPQDQEVIVLRGDMDYPQISFGHIVDKRRFVDYNGWNVPDVKYWMPFPPIK